MPKIGLSLRSCVAAMMNCEVNTDDIEKIISKEICRTNADWERLLKRLRRTAWQKGPARAVVLRALKLLRKEGKLEFPRNGGLPYPDIRDGKYWADDECEIRWLLV